MAKKSKARKPQRSKVERLMNLALWYWEYQRRNPEYRRWSRVLYSLQSFEQSLFEKFYEKHNPEEVVEVIGAAADPTTFQEMKDFVLVQMVRDDFGDEIAKKYLRSFILDQKFGSKFKRKYVPSEEGMNTEIALQSILAGEGVYFYPFEMADIAALLGMHHEWVVKVAGLDPGYHSMIEAKEVTVPVGPDVSMDTFEQASLECEVLYLLSQAVVREYGDEAVLDESVAEAALELLTDLDSVNTANIMRLAVLWLWDRIEEDNDESLDFDAKFKKHWGVLKDRANSAGMYKAPWNQIYDKKKRVLTALQNTNDCIMQMKIIDLNTKR